MRGLEVNQHPPAAVGTDGDQAGKQGQGVARLVHVDPSELGERQPPYLAVPHRGPRPGGVQVRGRHPQVQLLVAEVRRDHCRWGPTRQRHGMGEIAQPAVQEPGGRLVRADPQRGFSQRRMAPRGDYPAAEGAIPELLTASPSQGGQDPAGQQRGRGQLVRVGEVARVQEIGGGGAVGDGRSPGAAGLPWVVAPPVWPCSPARCSPGRRSPGRCSPRRSPGRCSRHDAPRPLLLGTVLPGTVLPGRCGGARTGIRAGPGVAGAGRLSRRERPRGRGRGRPGASAAPSRAGSGWQWSSREPSGWIRSLFSSKISRYRRPSPRYFCAISHRLSWNRPAGGFTT